VTAWIEGGSHHLAGPQFNPRFAPYMVPMLEGAADAANAGQQQVECKLMVLEAQYRSYLPAPIMPALEASSGDEREVRQLEGATQ